MTPQHGDHLQSLQQSPLHCFGVLFLSAQKRESKLHLDFRELCGADKLSQDEHSRQQSIMERQGLLKDFFT